MKTCTKCHNSKSLDEFTKHAGRRDGLCSHCKLCKSAANAEYRAVNRERLAAKSVTYYVANRDKIAAYQTAYNVANRAVIREKRAAYCAAYYAANREKIAAYRLANREKLAARSKVYYAANRERIAARYAAWYKANPDVSRTCGRNRRAKKRDSGGKLSPGLPAKLFKLQRGKCACCGKPLGDDYHLDHIMPLALGGANEDWNIQLLRPKCNLEKHKKDPIDFMISRGFLL